MCVMAQNTTECQEIPRIAGVLENIYPLGSLVPTPRPIQSLATDVAIGVRGVALPVPILTGVGESLLLRTSGNAVKRKSNFVERPFHPSHNTKHHG
jgi:hypothetical protein